MTSITTLKPLHAELAQFKGKRIFFEPLEGNNGDKLIEMGSHTLLQPIDAKLVSNPRQADAIDAKNSCCLNLSKISSKGKDGLKNI